MEVLIIIKFFLILAVAFYLTVHLGLTIGLRRCKQTKSPLQPFVSIIVAARNEEQNISRLIQCLTRQTYTPCEIILINDRSTDSTGKIIAEFQKNNPNIRQVDITSIPDNMPAKKNALRTGIEVSKGEILCFTDADCIPPAEWVNKLVKEFDPEVGLVAGYSPYQIPSIQDFKNRFLKKIFFDFIAYEEFRAAIWSAGSIGWNLGWLCTGRNLAYRRKVYDEVDGYEKIKMSVSGDDDLFLQLVRRQTAWKIRYVKTPGSFVPTLPAAGIEAFIEQRKRHFSAAKFFTFPMMLFFFAYHSSNLLLFISPFLFLLNVLFWPVIIICICIKIVSDTILFRSSCRIFDGCMFHHSYIFMEALYVFYNSIIGPIGFFRKFRWK